MRWLATPKVEQEEEREVRRFAWLPTLVDDKTRWIWLEHFTDHQRYAHYGYGYQWCSIARFSEGVPF